MPWIHWNRNRIEPSSAIHCPWPEEISVLKVFLNFAAFQKLGFGFGHPPFSPDCTTIERDAQNLRVLITHPAENNGRSEGRWTGAGEPTGNKSAERKEASNTPRWERDFLSSFFPSPVASECQNVQLQCELVRLRVEWLPATQPVLRVQGESAGDGRVQQKRSSGTANEVLFVVLVFFKHFFSSLFSTFSTDVFESMLCRSL